MRNMSFAMTTEQVRDKSKDLTRRLAWWNAKPGDIVQPIEKGQGLKKGEKVKKINGPIRILSTRGEQLCKITPDDVRREGFPGKSRLWFIRMMMTRHKCRRDKVVNRIEFGYM